MKIFYFLFIYFLSKYYSIWKEFQYFSPQNGIQLSIIELLNYVFEEQHLLQILSVVIRIMGWFKYLQLNVRM